MSYDCNVDEKIKIFWKKLENACPELKQIESDFSEIVRAIEKKFWEPTNEEPMRIAYFLKFLDVEPLIDEIKKFYKRPKKIE